MYDEEIGKLQEISDSLEEVTQNDILWDILLQPIKESVQDTILYLEKLENMHEPENIMN